MSIRFCLTLSGIIKLVSLSVVYLINRKINGGFDKADIESFGEAVWQLGEAVW